MMLDDSVDLLYQTLSSFLILTFFAQEVQVVCSLKIINVSSSTQIQYSSEVKVFMMLSSTSSTSDSSTKDVFAI